MHKRLVLSAVMALVGATLLATSAFGGQSKSSARGGTLRVLHSLSDYEYIDPQKCYDTGCSEMLWPVSYNLMQYAERNGPAGKRVYPEAAASMPKVSKNGRTYTFTLRKNHKASNGQVVTAAWFVRAWERLLSPKMGDAASARAGGIANFDAVVGAQQFYDGKAQKISGVQAKGKWTLVIRLKKNFPSLLSGLAMNWFGATPPTTPYSEEDMNRVVGAGPYFVSSREVGRNLVLDRNRFYKGNRPRNPDRIVVTVNGDLNQDLLQVRSGNADYLPGVPSAAAASLGEEFGVNKGRFFVKPTSVTSYFGLDTRPGHPFASVRLRKAVNWAVDRPAFVRIAGKYAGRRTVQILPPAMPGFKGNTRLYAYRGSNIAQAKKVAGDVSAVRELRILHSNSASNINRGQVLRNNLEQLGLKARTEPVPSSQLFSRAGDVDRGNYDIIAIGWQADYPDPRNFINVLLDGRIIPKEGSSNNVAFFNSAKFNRLMDKADALTGKARYNAYGNLDIQIMREAAPWIPWINSNNRLLVSSRTKNVVYNEANTNVAYNALSIQ